MSDSDRLEELRKQRARLAEELSRLESEIGKNEAPRPLPAARPKPAPSRNDPAAEELFRKLSANESVNPPSKSGCWTIFAVIMLIGIAIVTLAIRIRYR